METSLFEWIPGLGAFVEGYSLVVSKQHLPNTGSFDDAGIEELDQLTAEVKRILSSIYRVGTIIFEHGTAGKRRKAGCCIEHHHLHILPFDLLTIPNHLSRVLPPPTPVNSLHALRAFHAAEKPFIYYENTQGQGFVFDAPLNLPSQFMRQVLSVECGCANHWEWRQNPFIDRVTAFVAKVDPIARPPSRKTPPPTK